MNENENYEESCQKMKTENTKYLEIFQNDMAEKGLSEKTINRHVNNAAFYINEFLVYRESAPMEQGCFYISEFLGDFFIRKCMWSTPASIKSTAASLKKFYKCMADHGAIEAASYKEMCEIIKDNMDDWMDDCSQFNDPDQITPFSFF